MRRYMGEYDADENDLEKVLLDAYYDQLNQGKK